MRRFIRQTLEIAGPVIVYGTLAIAFGALLVASYGPPTQAHYELMESADKKLDNIQDTLDSSNELIKRLEQGE